MRFRAASVYVTRTDRRRRWWPVTCTTSVRSTAVRLSATSRSRRSSSCLWRATRLGEEVRSAERQLTYRIDRQDSPLQRDCAVDRIDVDVRSGAVQVQVG